MSQNIAIVSARFVFVELIGEIIYFPLWWYTRGAKKAFLYFWHALIDAEKNLAVWVWISNIFRPMYNQNDWQSQIISFVMRVIQIIIRSIALAIWTVVLAIGYIIWLGLPVFILLSSARRSRLQNFFYQSLMASGIGETTRQVITSIPKAMRLT